MRRKRIDFCNARHCCGETGADGSPAADDIAVIIRTLDQKMGYVVMNVESMADDIVEFLVQPLADDFRNFSFKFIQIMFGLMTDFAEFVIRSFNDR